VRVIIFVSFLVFTASAFAQSMVQSVDYSERFYYLGLIGGWAKVDWDPIISTDEATLVSNPTQADGKGGLFGLDVGMQWNKYFALEAEFIRMPDTYLNFSPAAYPAYHTLSTTSTMDFAAVIFKVMLPLGATPISLFTDIGPAYQHRDDDVANKTIYTGTFGAGALYRATEHWQYEVSFQYAPGYGKSIATPMDEYVPEIYAGTFKLNYLL